MGYYRRPYYLTMSGKPYLSLRPYSSDYKREYLFDYPKYASKEWYLNSWPRPSDDYLYWQRPGATRYPRYFPVHEWCPSHSYKYSREMKHNLNYDPIYSYSYPDYRDYYGWYDYDYLLPRARSSIYKSEPYYLRSYAY